MDMAYTEIVDLALKKNPDIILTVDNGIASHKGVNAATKAGFGSDHNPIIIYLEIRYKC